VTIDDWLTWLARDRGRSTNTIATYRRTIRTLHVDPFTATRDDIETWWRIRATDPEGNPRPHSSRNNELSAIRSFYRWCIRFDIRDDDPTVRLDPLREQKRESRFIGTTELEHLMAHLPADMRRAVALGAYGGLRVSEAAVLHWRDINQETRRMIVRGKGDKERQVGLPIRLLDVLLPDTGGNVVTGTAEVYSGHYLQMKVNDAMRRNGIVGMTFHNLRHRYGYMAASDGAPPTSIARAMGHASLVTTMRYVAALDSDLDRIAEAVTRR
jgi:site-specific recombinase XerD